MNITLDLIQSIVARHAADSNISGKIIADLQSINGTVSDRRAIDRDERAERDRHGKAMGEIAGRRSAMQAACEHAKTMHHGDPSGNGGGHRECEVCGKQD